MANHCFLSYSTADGLEFARNLADHLEGGEDQYVNVWFDKRDLKPSLDWDEQIAEAIRSCRCLLFVMTNDSTAPGSVCKNEWTWALRYKKPIVPLRVSREAEMPFGLGSRQCIDFTGEFEAGLAKLRLYLRWLETAEGLLQAMRDRLADAERDLRRASPEEEARIRVEIEELKAEIARQEEEIRNPRAAESRTRQLIETGLERERQPEQPPSGRSTTRFVNPPPGIAPVYFQDRYVETRLIGDFLRSEDERLLTITGRAGVGKTALVCRALKALEAGRLPDDLGELRVGGIVYLSETGVHRINFPNLFADLLKLLPPTQAEELEAVYKDARMPAGEKMRCLLDAFPTGRVVVLLDNFENVLDPESEQIREKELREALEAVLCAPQHSLKVILTTRLAPRELDNCQPGRQRPLPLDEGLDSPHAENMLRAMDADGILGLKNAPADLLARAREKTRGYPRALEALHMILAADRYTTLAELLDMPLPENVVYALVGEAFNRLDPQARQVMQALSVYSRPVRPAAVDYLLQPHWSGADSVPILRRLARMHFVRPYEGGKYYLHPADRDFAFQSLPEGKKNPDEENADPQARQPRSDFTRLGLLYRAADFFRKVRKPCADCKRLEDLEPLLIESELLDRAGEYKSAAYIRIQFYEQALRIYSEIGDRRGEGDSLAALGNAYTALGDPSQASDLYEKALSIYREISDRGGEENARAKYELEEKIVILEGFIRQAKHRKLEPTDDYLS